MDTGTIDCSARHRAAWREDLQATAAELVFGETLRFRDISHSATNGKFGRRRKFREGILSPF